MQQSKSDLVIYWLVRRSGDAIQSSNGDIEQKRLAGSESDQVDCPGEVTPAIHESNEYAPNKHNGKGKDDGKSTARVAPTVTEKGKKQTKKHGHEK